MAKKTKKQYLRRIVVEAINIERETKMMMMMMKLMMKMISILLEISPESNRDR
jgi:hypothetical protein